MASGCTYVWRMMIVFFVSQWIALPAESAKILALQAVAGKSHWNFMSAVLRSLTDVGHHVTVFTQFPDGERNNYTEVDISENFPMKLEQNVMDMINNFSGPLYMAYAMTPLCRMHCDMMYKSKRLSEIIKDGQKHFFDIIIMEPLVSDCMSYLASTLNIPIIYSIPSPMLLSTEFYMLGHMPNPAYVSGLFSRYAVPKTFLQRFTNVFHMLYSYSLKTVHEFLLKKFDSKPYDSAPKVDPSIIFINTHHITEAPRPVSPNLIEIGGIHLKAPKSLSNDILDFIEDSPSGVIFFTFGSTIKISSLSGDVEDAFKQALSKVPQKVLWKYEGEMIDKPKNVMIRKWFPQREVLLHPKVKLFISHGGMSSVYESIDAGVPVLGIPLFYDQARNIDHLVNNEIAISLDLLTVTEEKLLYAITELINNTKYMNNAMINSLRLKDRPMSPQQSVVYWTEYVIRHKGAPHLKSHSLNLTWYQYFLLDVILVFLIVIYLVKIIICRIVKLFLKYTSTLYRLYKNKVKSE